MMLSGLEWRKCSDCPKKFLVFPESTRRRCLDCTALQNRRRESKRWHRDKGKQAA